MDLIERWAITSIAPIPSARNQHYDVTQGGRSLILRRYRHDHFGDLPFEREVMATLTRRGWPVAHIIDHARDDEAEWLLMSRCPGASRPTRTRAEQRERGRMLAQLHTELESFDRDRQGFAPIDEVVHSESLTGKLGHFATRDRPVAQRLERYLVATREMFNRVSIDTCRRTVIHGDFVPWNLLFEGDELTGIIDFEACHRTHFVFDFAMAWRGNYDSVIDGYEDVRPLSADERALIVPCFWAWLFFGIDHDLRHPGDHAFDWALKQFARRQSRFFDDWRGLLPG